MDVDVLAVYPHAHYLGHVLEGYATLPNGERKWLIRIPDWDPNWQGAYHYREPRVPSQGHGDFDALSLRQLGARIRAIRISRRAACVAGNQATDEMGHLWLQVLPRARRDHR